jgi:hypothetical protein
MAIPVGVNLGGGWSSQNGANTVRYRGDNAGVGAGGPLNYLMFGGLQDYLNSGALSDMILGGRGFGQSRRFRQYDPFDPDYGYLKRPGTGQENTPGGNPSKGGPYNPKPVDDTDPEEPIDGPGGWEQELMRAFSDAQGENGFDVQSFVQALTGAQGGAANGAAQLQGGAKAARLGGAGESLVAQAPGTEGGGGSVPPYKNPGHAPMGPGAQPDPGRKYGNQDTEIGTGTVHNPEWMQWDDAPVEGEGLLGDIGRYGEWNDIERGLMDALQNHSTGELMDLEDQELGMWNDFGKQNRLERATEDAIGWQRTGELSDLEQQEKWGYKGYADPTALENEVGDAWRGVSGPGQYDELRGETLTGMVEKPGLSDAEKGAMLASQTLPIQQALAAQKREGDARAAATGNAAGRWGASNAMALNAAGQAGQAGRNVQTAAADYMRRDRAEGLEGLGGLQGQIDARKVQGASGLSNLSGQQRQAGALSLQGLSSLSDRQRKNQQYGIDAGMNLNAQQRGAQAQAAQGVGGLGQRARANAQWGLSGIADMNKMKSDQGLAKIGLTKDMWDSVNARGDAAADRAARIGGLVAGGQNESGGSSFNAGVSV